MVVGVRSETSKAFIRHLEAGNDDSEITCDRKKYLFISHTYLSLQLGYLYVL